MKRWYEDSLIYDLLTSNPDHMSAAGRDGQALGCMIMFFLALGIVLSIIKFLCPESFEKRREPESQWEGVPLTQFENPKSGIKFCLRNESGGAA